jgi:hypothetical protein
VATDYVKPFGPVVVSTGESPLLSLFRFFQPFIVCRIKPFTWWGVGLYVAAKGWKGKNERKKKDAGHYRSCTHQFSSTSLPGFERKLEKIRNRSTEPEGRKNTNDYPAPEDSSIFSVWASFKLE